ncbi:MAG: hypothetical protein AAB446_01175 [Patescibacteria group bacterium]
MEIIFALLALAVFVVIWQMSLFVRVRRLKSTMPRVSTEYMRYEESMRDADRSHYLLDSDENIANRQEVRALILASMVDLEKGGSDRFDDYDDYFDDDLETKPKSTPQSNKIDAFIPSLMKKVRVEIVGVCPAGKTVKVLPVEKPPKGHMRKKYNLALNSISAEAIS